MSWCPKCRKEYSEGSQCSDCNLDLVNNLEQSKHRVNNKIINYIGYANWIAVILIVLLMLNLPSTISNRMGFIIYYLIFSFVPPLICIILAAINRDLKGLNFINVLYLLIYILAFITGKHLILHA